MYSFISFPTVRNELLVNEKYIYFLLTFRYLIMDIYTNTFLYSYPDKKKTWGCKFNI